MKCFYCQKELSEWEENNTLRNEDRAYCESHYHGIVERKWDFVDFLHGLFVYCERNHSGQSSREYQTMSRIYRYWKYVQYKSCYDPEYYFKQNVKDSVAMLNGYMLGFRTFYKPRKEN